MTASMTPVDQTPRATRLPEVRPLALIAVFSTSEPNLAGLLGCSRFTAYSDARAGRWPTVRVGRRVMVAVPHLRRALGDLPADGLAPAAD